MAYTTYINVVVTHGKTVSPSTVRERVSRAISKIEFVDELMTSVEDVFDDETQEYLESW